MLDGVRSSCPSELLNDGDLIMQTDRILEQRAETPQFVSPRFEGHARARRSFGLGRYGSWIGFGMVRLTRLLSLGARGLIMLLLMHVVTCLVSVGIGVQLFWSCTVSMLPSPVAQET